MLYAALAINVLFLISNIAIFMLFARNNWLKNAEAKLNSRLAGQHDLVTLADKILIFLCRYLKVQVGALYMLEQEPEQFNKPQLKMLASYAYSERKQLANSFALGEGLVGQAALEKKLIIINTVSSDYVKIRSGLGEMRPKQLLVIPFLYEDKLYGVIELGKVRAFKSFEIKLLKQLMPRIGIAINTAQAQHKMQNLLQQTQEFSGALQNQQEAVLAREERIRAIVDTVVDGIITINEKGHIQSFNKAAEHIFGYAETEVVHKNVSLLMPEPYHAEHDGYLRNYLHTGVAKIIGNPREVRAKRKDGSVFPIDLAVAEMQVMGERMFTGIVRDITERKAAEDEIKEQQIRLKTSNEELQMQQEEMQASNEELQAQEEELRQINEELLSRSRILEQQKQAIHEKNGELEQARSILELKAQELEQANRYKSEFLANISHELRTPLNSLLILAQLLADNKQGNLADKQIEYAKTIHSAGSELLDLINDILDLSKVEAGKIELNPEIIHLVHFVQELTLKFEHLAQSKGLAFTIDLAIELTAEMQTDMQRLKQVLNNLISNALKFTEHGSVTLTIEGVAEEDLMLDKLGLTTENAVVFRVSDTGIGIPLDKQTVVFEAFQQADGTTSRRFGGTGLGLSISRQLAQLLGGDIELHSEVGNGSCFSLYLPLHITSAAPISSSVPVVPLVPLSAESKQAKSIVSESTAQSLPTVSLIDENLIDDREDLQADENSILIIEDDANFSSILLELTHERGFKCLRAKDGCSGIELAIRYAPKAIILDMGLPKVDGLTVMETLKENPITRHIPVHCMSGSTQNRDAMKKLGAIGYLLKPVSMPELAEALQDLTQFINNRLRCLLIVVDNQANRDNIARLVDNQTVEQVFATDKSSTIAALKRQLFDCIIIDVDVNQGNGISLLAQIHHETDLSNVPVIVYAERPLASSEDDLLSQCEQTLTIKHAHSPEHLLDEATLFLHQVEAHLSPEKQQILRKLHDKEALLAHKKVLIVDDDPRNSFALITLLEEKNMEVFTADNGKEALSILTESPDVDLVLMDVMMPEMDGYEAMQQIRNQPQFRRLPIIALTAKAMKGDKAKCIEAGANDYLPKPIETDKLISLMRVWLY